MSTTTTTTTALPHLLLVVLASVVHGKNNTKLTITCRQGKDGNVVGENTCISAQNKTWSEIPRCIARSTKFVDSKDKKYMYDYDYDFNCVFAPIGQDPVPCPKTDKEREIGVLVCCCDTDLCNVDDLAKDCNGSAVHRLSALLLSVVVVASLVSMRWC